MSTTQPDRSRVTQLMDEFEGKMLAHPILKQVSSELLEKIHASSGQPITAVVGPTLVGKSTLSNNIQKEILAEEAEQCGPRLGISQSSV